MKTPHCFPLQVGDDMRVELTEEQARYLVSWEEDT
jgi:hypothetical protein